MGRKYVWIYIRNKPDEKVGVIIKYSTLQGARLGRKRSIMEKYVCSKIAKTSKIKM